MTFPIRQPPDGDTAWGNDVRATIAAANDHETRVGTLEASQATIASVVYTGSGNLAASDAGKAVEINSASAVTVTIANGIFPVGAVIEVLRYGAGSVTLAPGAGVTFHQPAGSPLTLRAQYSSASLRQRVLDEWIVSGDLG